MRRQTAEVAVAVAEAACEAVVGVVSQIHVSAGAGVRQGARGRRNP